MRGQGFGDRIVDIFVAVRAVKRNRFLKGPACVLPEDPQGGLLYDSPGNTYSTWILEITEASGLSFQ